MLLSGAEKACAQENVTTFGIQVRPIIPTQIFNSGFAAYSDEEWKIDIGPKFGMNFGMVVRHGFSKMWSLETGINFNTRNFSVDASFNDTVFTDTDYKMISYEIPVKALVYIRMTEQWFVNTAFGLSANMYPSNIFTADTYFDHFTARTNWIQGAIIGNVGFEYRTKEKGYFYIGGTLHRPFSPIARSRITFHRLPSTTDGEAILDLTGNYFTVDLRYFFHEDPAKKEKRKKKKDQ